MSESDAPFRSRGYSDRPTCQDALGMEDRYRGLAKFICECETPMTIAINGDWGSGKSSAMQIIQQHLDDYAGGGIEKQLVLFNTWEFSIISDNSKLVFELLQTLNEKLGQLEALYGGGEDKKAARDTGKLLMAIGGAVKGAALGVLEDSGIKPILDIAKGAGEALAKASGEESPSLEPVVYTSPTRLLRNVSEQIQERIRNIVSKLPKLRRLFIFVDDLDRLEPGIALELIEGMKNFASYENCVFVLAVDQSVVERGLKSKYGNEISDEMAQHFFDKIIQLPFQLPVNAYKLSSYIQSLLKKGAIAPDEGDLAAMAENLASLLKKFRITNPRTIKRSFNMLQMYQCISESRDGANPPEKTAEQYYRQYAVLLLSLTSPEDHAKMAQLVDSNRDYTDARELQRMQREFQILRNVSDGEDCSEYIAAVLDMFYDGSDDARATKDLVDALTLTKSDDVDHDAYSLARFLLELLSRLEDCPENREAIRACPEWQAVACFSSPYALAKRKDNICMELGGLAGGTRIKIFWERAKQFYISLHSPKLDREYLDKEGMECFTISTGGAQRDRRESEDTFSCYIYPGRITIFVSGTRNAEKIFRVMEDCGFFGSPE